MIPFTVLTILIAATLFGEMRRLRQCGQRDHEAARQCTAVTTGSHEHVWTNDEELYRHEDPSGSGHRRPHRARYDLLEVWEAQGRVELSAVSSRPVASRYRLH